MNDFDALLSDYLSDPEEFSAAKECGPVERISQCHDEGDQLRVVCHYPGDNREVVFIKQWEVMAWMWAKLKPVKPGVKNGQ